MDNLNIWDYGSDMIKTILLDMDGVVADFNLQIALTLRPYLSYENATRMATLSDEQLPETSWQNLYGMTDDEVWDEVDAVDPQVFWSNLSPLCNRFPGTPMPGQLYNWAKEKVNNVAFCTAFPERSAAVVTTGKMNWLRNYIHGDFADVILCRRKHKQYCARFDACLIDDSAQNCAEFQEAGGSVIQYRPVPLAVLDAAFKKIQQGYRRVDL